MHVDICAMKAYLCDQGCTVSLFLSFCCILHLVNKHSITLIPSYILSQAVSGELCVSSSNINSSGSVLVSSGICHKLIQTSHCSSSLSDGGSWLSSFQHVGRHPSSVFHHKVSCHGYLSRLGGQGSAVTSFNPLAAQRYVLCRQGFSSSVCQALVG